MGKPAGTRKKRFRFNYARFSAIAAAAMSTVLVLQGCFDPAYPQRDRQDRVTTAKDPQSRPEPGLSLSGAVAYALRHNLEARIAEVASLYQNEAAVAAFRRLAPLLASRYTADKSSCPVALWPEDMAGSGQTSSSSSAPDAWHADVGMVWNILDFGLGQLNAGRQTEKTSFSAWQISRIRQQLAFDVAAHYWRASAAFSIAGEVEKLRAKLDEATLAIRKAAEMHTLSGEEGARQELAVYACLAEFEQWQRNAAQARIDLARVMGCGSAVGLDLEPFPETAPNSAASLFDDPALLQQTALRLRSELVQDAVSQPAAVNDAKAVQVQLAPSASLSLTYGSDSGKYLQWNEWMAAGVKVGRDLLNMSARFGGSRQAGAEEEADRIKKLASAAVMAQVGIAYSEWRITLAQAAILFNQAQAQARLVEALAADETNSQTRPGEVFLEEVKLVKKKALALQALAETRIASARIANAIGVDFDTSGNAKWDSVGLDSHSGEAPLVAAASLLQNKGAEADVSIAPVIIESHFLTGPLEDEIAADGEEAHASNMVEQVSESEKEMESTSSFAAAANQIAASQPAPSSAESVSVLDIGPLLKIPTEYEPLIVPNLYDETAAAQETEKEVETESAAAGEEVRGEPLRQLPPDLLFDNLPHVDYAFVPGSEETDKRVEDVMAMAAAQGGAAAGYASVRGIPNVSDPNSSYFDVMDTLSGGAYESMLPNAILPDSLMPLAASSPIESSHNQSQDRTDFDATLPNIVLPDSLIP